MTDTLQNLRTPPRRFRRLWQWFTMLRHGGANGARMVLGLATATVALAVSSAPPTNIVFLLADDLGYAELSCYGAKEIRTPAIDQLAREGLLKYVINSTAGTTKTEGLFDIGADMGEKNDLVAARAADVARLRRLLAVWGKEMAPMR